MGITGIIQIEEINELLSKALKHECHLNHQSEKTFCTLEFPNVSDFTASEKIIENCKRLLSPYGIKIGNSSFDYRKKESEEARVKVFVLKISGLSFGKLLEIVKALSNDLQDESVQSTQAPLEGATGGVAKTSGERNIKDIIQFFSPMNSLNDDRKIAEPSFGTNLAK